MGRPSKGFVDLKCSVCGAMFSRSLAVHESRKRVAKTNVICCKDCCKKGGFKYKTSNERKAAELSKAARYREKNREKIREKQRLKRAQRDYGEFAEAKVTLMKLINEIEPNRKKRLCLTKLV